MATVKNIRALIGFSNVADADVVQRGTAVQTNMTGNSNFPNPPVDLAVLKTNIDTFSALMVEALDGSKKVIAERKKQRATVVEMLRLLGRFVEVASKNDMAIFQTSGFEAASTVRAPVAPLSEKIRKIDHGDNSGQMLVWVRSIRGATSYELRYAPAVNGGLPSSWASEGVAGVKQPVILTGLTPGTTYVFQARALGKNGYTDWSDSVTFICT